MPSSNTNKIKEKLLGIKDINNDVYNIIINEKLEFNSIKRFIKILKQALRKYRIGGLKAALHKPSSKKIISRINSPSPKKKILYITITPTFNLMRQSVYIQKNEEYETILLMENPWLLKLMNQSFDAVYIYDTYYELANILMRVKPYLIHVQGSMMGSDILCVYAKLFSDRKVVFEFYDVPSFFISKEDSICTWGRDNTEIGFFAEKYACENADGVILGYSKKSEELLKKRHAVETPMLEFHSYVCDEFIANKDTPKLSQKDGRIHLLFCGMLVTSDLPKKIFGDYLLHELIEEITKQDICLDVYTSPHVSPIKFEWQFAEYISISRENNLFRFTKGLFPAEAANEFARYDFGIIIFLFNQGGTLLQENTEMRLPGRFFLYLEAGLPVVVSDKHTYICEIVKKYEIGIVVSQKDIFNLSKIIPTYDYDKLRKNVLVARNELSMDAHIHTLLKFYEDCSS